MSYAALVTGATGGIGREVVAQLRAAGRSVLALGHEIDLTRPEAVAEVIALVESGYEGLDGFIHLAGFDAPAPIGFIDPLLAQDLYRVHALFPMQFLGWMMKRRHHAPGAQVVLVSSEAAEAAAPGHAAYAAAKGALAAFARTAAAELKPADLGVRLVTLGPVDTKMTHTWWDKLPPANRPVLATPAEAARVVLGLEQKGGADVG